MVGFPQTLNTRLISCVDILPLIRLGLDSPTHTLVDASIKCLPVVLPVLDFSTVKNDVFPPIASTFSRTSSLAIKVRSLEAFSVLCGGSVEDTDGFDDDLTGSVQPIKSKSIKSSILDKYTIQEKLVPSLKAIKTKEPAVMMAALKVFRQVGTVADTDFLALEVVPILWSFSLGPLLNLQQFNEFMALIKTISSKIEKEQTRKLQELSSGGDSAGFRNGTDSFSQSATDLTSGDMDNARNNFERLVLGKGAAPSNGQNNMDIWDSMEPEAAKPPRPSLSPSFSWQANNNQQSGFRSITPDQKLTSFPSLEPTVRQGAPMTSPMASAFPSTQGTAAQSSASIWDTPSTSYHQARGSRSGASLSSLSTMTSSTQPMPQQRPNYSAFAVPPPPSGAMGSNTALRSPPSSAFPSNTINPPLQQQQQQPQQQPQQPKQGLAKYESLL